MKIRAAYAYSPWLQNNPCGLRLFLLSSVKIRVAYACNAPILLKAKAIKIGAN